MSQKKKSKQADPAGQPVSELTQQQVRAIDLLLSGLTQQQVADAVGVDRRTITRWVHDTPPFMAEYNAGLLVMQASALAAMRGMINKAVEVIKRQLNSTDDRLSMRAAVQVLRLSGVNGGQVLTLDDLDPAIIERRLKSARIDRFLNGFVLEPEEDQPADDIFANY